MSILSWRTLIAGTAHWLSGAIWYTVFAGTFAVFIGPDGLARLATRNEPLALALAFVSSLAVAGALGYTLRRGGRYESAAARGLVVLWMLVVAGALGYTLRRGGRYESASARGLV